MSADRPTEREPAVAPPSGATRVVEDGSPAELDGVSYAEAIAELEGLLDDLERDEADVDELAAKVRRAAALIRFCRSRITGARVEIDRIVADLE